MASRTPVLEQVTRFVFEGRDDQPGIRERVLLLDQVRDLYQRAKALGPERIHDNLLQLLDVEYRIAPGDLERIPRSGPTLVVANHPFGILEGPILGSLLPRVRPDVKVMTNYLLSGMEELRPFCIFVDPFNGPGSERANLRAMREALEWLRSGKMLVVFPSGEVSHWSLRNQAVADPDWNPGIGRLIRKTRASVLPLFFDGANSVPFHLLGLIHPRLRTAALISEFLNKRGRTVELRVGRPIPAQAVGEIADDADLMRYLRCRTYLLGRREARVETAAATTAVTVVAGETDVEAMKSEVDALPVLEETREFKVCLAQAAQIPACLREIGRLRELTFRAVGEGTGKSLDLDRYDRTYQHLFAWHKQAQQIAGAYRLCRTDAIVREQGLDGLYSRSLFRYDQRLIQAMGPAVELGRSFVRPEYQKQFAPLLLLWKGIGRYVADHPEAAVLFGAVSISNEYSEASRQLMVRYLEAESAGDPLARLVKPRRPFRPKPMREWDTQALNKMFHDLDGLAAPISDLEPDGKGIPILLKQYAKLGGRVLSFSVDPQFGNALDGLILVDLRQTEPALLERYLGKDGAVRFAERHFGQSAA